MDKRLCDLINVINLGLFGNVAGRTTDLIDDIDLEQLYSEAKRHNIQSYIYYCLRPFADHIKSINNDIWIKFEEANRQAIRKNMLLDAERSEIIKFFEANNIWYMPLKGIILQDYYPEYGTRQMADNDILVDSEYRLQIRDYMIERGYHMEDKEMLGNHDAYIKKPCYNYEIHMELMHKSKDGLYDYYHNIQSKLVQNGTGCGRHFSLEDFYIFMMAHAYKHHIGPGTGLKILIDSYYYLKREENNMDWNYIFQQCGILGISKFEYSIRSLIAKLFSFNNDVSLSIQELSDSDALNLNLLFDAGTYGTMKRSLVNIMHMGQFDSNNMSRLQKMRFMWFRLFPDYEYLVKSYPYVENRRWMIPICWIKRIISIIKRSDRLKSEISLINKF